MAINPKIKQKAEDIRKKIFGSEVRESLASGIEAISEDVEATIGRQDYVEEQFQDVLDETTGKDVISAPELIAARNGKSNLKTRLDDEHAQVTAQLQQTENNLSDRAINVKYPPAPFVAAKGDGVSDDSLAIQNILDSFNEVFIPEGTFVASIVLNRNGQVLKGTGRRSVIIPANNTWGIGINGIHINVHDLLVSLPPEFTGDGILTQIPDGTNSRFLTFSGVVKPLK